MRCRAVGTPQRVLIVDNDRDLADTLRVALEMTGHTVAIVNDSTAALNAARVFMPDVVVSDIVMPLMSGHRVAEAIRADPELCHVQLVAMSGFGHEQDKRDSLAAGFDEHLTKPNIIDPLLALLAERTRDLTA